MPHLDFHGLLGDLCFQFSPRRSTKIALMYVWERSLEMVDEESDALLVLLDFPAALDKIDHGMRLN